MNTHGIREISCPLGAACDTVGKKHRAGSKALREHTEIAKGGAGSVSSFDPTPRSVSRPGGSAVRFSDCESVEEFIELADVTMEMGPEDTFRVNRADTGAVFEMSTDEAEIMTGAEFYDEESQRDALVRVLEFMPKLRSYNGRQISEEAVFRYVPNDEDARAFEFAKELKETSEGLRELGRDPNGNKILDVYDNLRGDIYDDDSYEDDEVEEPGVYDYGFAIRDAYGIRFVRDSYRRDPDTGEEVGFTTLSTGDDGSDEYREFSFHRSYGSPLGRQDFTEMLGNAVLNLGRAGAEYGGVDEASTDSLALEIASDKTLDFSDLRDRVHEEEERLIEWRGIAQRFFGEG